MKRDGEVNFLNKRTWEMISVRQYELAKSQDGQWVVTEECPLGEERPWKGAFQEQ